MNTVRKVLRMAVWILLASSQTRSCAVALGSALTPGQRQQMTAYFHAGPAAKEVTVRGPEHNAGNARMMSAACVLVQVGTPDSGVRVRVYHITQVGALMYAVALGTAGVGRDQVVAARLRDGARCRLCGQPASLSALRECARPTTSCASWSLWESMAMTWIRQRGCFGGLAMILRDCERDRCANLVMGRAKRLGGVQL